MKDGDLIRHKTHKCNGVLVGTPRAHGTHCKARLDGNITAQYYHRGDIEVIGPYSTPTSGPEHVRPPAAPAPVPPPTPALPVDPDPISRAIAATTPKDRPAPPQPDAYTGDLTLDRIIQVRNELRRRMEELDDEIAQVRVSAAIRLALQSIRCEGDVTKRTELSGEALKIKRDYDQALAAAKRLSARGAL